MVCSPFIFADNLKVLLMTKTPEEVQEEVLAIKRWAIKCGAKEEVLGQKMGNKMELDVEKYVKETNLSN